MLRLGLQLTLRSGREALVRLLITAAAVAVGVALLLGVLAEFHAYQTNANKACWSCTQGTSLPGTLPTHGELWKDRRFKWNRHPKFNILWIVKAGRHHRNHCIALAI